MAGIEVGFANGSLQHFQWQY